MGDPTLPIPRRPEFVPQNIELRATRYVTCISETGVSFGYVRYVRIPNA